MRRTFVWMTVIIPLLVAACTTPTAPPASAAHRTRAGLDASTVTNADTTGGGLPGVTIGGST